MHTKDLYKFVQNLKGENMDLRREIKTLRKALIEAMEYDWGGDMPGRDRAFRLYSIAEGGS